MARVALLKELESHHKGTKSTKKSPGFPLCSLWLRGSRRLFSGEPFVARAFTVGTRLYPADALFRAANCARISACFSRVMGYAATTKNEASRMTAGIGPMRKRRAVRTESGWLGGAPPGR